MAILTIDGVGIPAPSSLKIQQSDLDSADTNRNEEGYLQRDRIRQGIYKLELEWKGITNTQLAIILNAIKPASVVVRFPTENGIVTKTMYAGNRNVEVVRYKNDNDIRWNLSFNLIEY